MVGFFVFPSRGWERSLSFVCIWFLHPLVDKLLFLIVCYRIYSYSALNESWQPLRLVATLSSVSPREKGNGCHKGKRHTPVSLPSTSGGIVITCPLEGKDWVYV